jgi:hypothetical protein
VELRCCRRLLLLRCNATKQEEEEGDDSNAAIAFFFFFFLLQHKEEEEGEATAALLWSPSFAMLHCSVAKQVLQRSVTFFAMLRYKAAPQTNKQNKQEKKK